MTEPESTLSCGENCPRSILLVEDDAGHLAQLQSAFAEARERYELTSVSTLQAAREHLARKTPDVLICDLHLPDGSGADLLPGDIAESPYPILVLTASANEKTAASAIKAGASDYVTKNPSAIKAMPQIVGRVLRGWQQIVERRRAEEALQRERRHLAGLIQAMPPIVIGILADGKIRLVNPVGEQITGYSSAELKGRNWCRILFVDHHSARAEQTLLEAKNSFRTVTREIPLCTRMGKERFVSWDLTALRDEQGAVTELLALGTDLTERRQADAMSRIQTSALQAVANCVIITERNGCIKWVNPSFTRLTGFAFEEAVGKDPRILRSGAHDTNFYRKLWDTILSGQVWEGVMVNRRKDGTLYEEEMTITPVPDEAGKITHFIAIKQDVTERKKAERAMETYAQSLEQTTRELTEITRIAEQTREEAERANKVKSEFLAKMSHELRTPLNSIIGFTELMIEDKADPPTPKRAGRLEKVHRNAKNLLALINDILDLSKIEADRLSLDMGRVDLTRLIRECVESTQPLVKSGVTLSQDLDPSVLNEQDWFGDEIRIRQSLTNLLSNAAKFTESGRIEVRARIDQDLLQIEVEDTGVGIAAGDLSRIFLEFEQVDSSSTRRAGGTGLGLAITQRLCRMMKGEITVQSELGVGTCFTIRLPRLPEAGETRTCEQTVSA